MKPSKGQLQESVSVICKVIGQIPCFHIYERYVAHRFDVIDSEVALKAMIHNAVLDSTLISLRCFNEFFKPGGTRDDIRCHHYSGVSVAPFLKSSEEQSINKYLAHVTLTRLDIVTKPWILDDMVTRGLERGIEFLTLIEAQFPPHTEAATAEVKGVIEAARRLIRLIGTA